MLLVKIKPLGWILVALLLIGVGGIGFVLSRTAGGRASADSEPIVVATPAVGVDFTHISANDPAVTKALSADDLDAGEKVLNKPCSFQGKVHQVYSPSNKAVEILNFADNFSDAFGAAVDAVDYGKLPDLNSLSGKRVLVTGTMIAYKKHLEIKVNSPSQIKIIDESAPAAKG